ncbi:MAG: glycine betaine catabolism [Solirubrobacteraceae bacterium]|jgi:Rieske 2Fe-2S family protein|nr:glycine betaine catabolism [Solirubrobacteraceae bacterium]
MSAVHASLPLSISELERTRRPMERATALPGAAFTDPAVLDWELEHVFAAGWLCVGHADQVRERGDYLMADLGTESVFVIADDEGEPRAFLNTCRHRGARLVDAAEGRLTRLQCPYHAWSYGFDGALRNAPHTEEIEDFDPGCFGLRAVRCAVVEGLVLVDLSGSAPAPEDHVGELAPWLARYRLGELRRARRIVYEVDANWKAIAENYSECLHCPGVHPELNRLSHYLSGDTIRGAGAWCGGSMILSEGAQTMGVDGGAARPPIAGLDGDDVRSILYFLLFPNALVSLHPDYVMLHTLWPRAVDRTEVVCDWLFEPATMAADGFDPSDAVGFWDEVNRQDWHVCALTQRGMSSRGFEPGRYTTQETDVHAFDVMVAERYLDALAAPMAVGR